MKQTASWNLPKITQNLWLISVLKQSSTGPNLEQSYAVHILLNYFKVHFNIIFPLMSMTQIKYLLFKIEIQILNGT